MCTSIISSSVSHVFSTSSAALCLFVAKHSTIYQTVLLVTPNSMNTLFIYPYHSFDHSPIYNFHQPGNQRHTLMGISFIVNHLVYCKTHPRNNIGCGIKRYARNKPVIKMLPPSHAHKQSSSQDYLSYLQEDEHTFRIGVFWYILRLTIHQKYSW